MVSATVLATYIRISYIRISYIRVHEACNRSIIKSLLLQICIALEAVLILNFTSVQRMLAPGWLLFPVNFDPINTGNWVKI